MAQFDSLVISPLLMSLIIFLFFYYDVSIKFFIPNFFGNKKFRGKKLNLFVFYNFFDTNLDIKTASSVSVAF